MHLRCPHCHNPIEVVEDRPPPEVYCASCGSSFRLEGQQTGSWWEGAAGRTVGRFVLRAQLGSGAFGTVYQAHDPDLDRTVAIKVPRVGNVPGAEGLDRFLREARSAAQLRHASIVSVHEVGQHEGVPYIVSDFVAGVTLADWLTGRRPTAREAAQLVADVADALHYAHEHGVTHRDVKPSNIMVDVEGRPRVMDFGLAKREAGEITMTVEGQILGTPAYMSPEQARGDSHGVDRRSDVYSLGVILYELLTGELPFRGNQRMLLHQVLHDEPRPPRKLIDRIPRDLETVTLRALAKEPGRRYPTAQALAEELRRFLAGEAVLARPVGRAEKAWRWCRRNPTVAALTGAVAVLLLAVATGATIAAVRFGELALTEQGLRHQANLAQDSAEKQAEENRQRLVRLHVANGNRLVDEGRPFDALVWLTEALRLDSGDEVREAMHRDRLALVLRHAPRLCQVWFHDAAVHGVALSGDGRHAVTTTAKPDGPGKVGQLVIGVDVWRLADGAPVPLPFPDAGPVRFLAFSPDGRRAVTVATDGTARVWEWDTARPLTPPVKHSEQVSRAAFTPDGRTVATAGGDGTVQVWGAITGTPLYPSLRHDGPVSDVTFSPDGRYLVTGGNHMVRAWDAVTGQPVTSHRCDTTSLITWCLSPDSRRLAFSQDGVVLVWDLAAGRAMGPRLSHSPPASPGASRSAAGHARIGPLAFSPDSRRLVTGGLDGSARVWDVVTGEVLELQFRHQGPVNAVAFSPDGRHVVTASVDTTARVWDAGTGTPVSPLLPHRNRVPGAKFSADGQLLLTLSGNLDGYRNGEVRVWEWTGAGDAPLNPLSRAVPSGDLFSTEARRVILRNADESLQVWDTASGRPLSQPFASGGRGASAKLSRDGRRVLTSGADGVRVWDATTGEAVAGPFPRNRVGTIAAIDPTGQRWVSLHEDGSAKVYDATTARPVGPALHLGQRICKAAFSPDGRRVSALGLRPDSLQAWEVETGRPLFSPVTVGQRVIDMGGWLDCVAFSSDGRRLLSSRTDGDSGSCQLWDAETGRPLLPAPLTHDDTVLHASFSPDGRRVATTSMDNMARVWDSSTGELLGPPLAHRASVSEATFSPDGRRVVTASWDNTARVWDAATGEPLGPALMHAASVAHARFDADGRRVFTLTEDSTFRAWDLPGELRAIEDLATLARLLSGRRLHPVGGLVRVEESSRATWQELCSRFPDYVTPRTASATDWHRRQAAECEAQGQWAAAAWHLDRLLVKQPDDPLLVQRRRTAEARLKK